MINALTKRKEELLNLRKDLIAQTRQRIEEVIQKGIGVRWKVTDLTTIELFITLKTNDSRHTGNIVISHGEGLFNTPFSVSCRVQQSSEEFNLSPKDVSYDTAMKRWDGAELYRGMSVLLSNADLSEEIFNILYEFDNVTYKKLDDEYYEVRAAISKERLRIQYEDTIARLKEETVVLKENAKSSSYALFENSDIYYNATYRNRPIKVVKVSDSEIELIESAKDCKIQKYVIKPLSKIVWRDFD